MHTVRHNSAAETRARDKQGPAAINRTGQRLNKQFMVLETIFQNEKGRVYKARYWKWFWWPCGCLIRESSNDPGMRQELERQYHLLKKLQGIVHMPQPISLFYSHGNTFLAMQYVRGENIGQVIHLEYEAQQGHKLTAQCHRHLIGYLLQIIGILEQLHHHGYMYRDITPQHFLVNHRQEVVLTDPGAVFGITGDDPVPHAGSTGAPQKLNGQRLIARDDIYGLGGLMIWFFTNQPPENFDYLNVVNLRAQLRSIINSCDLVKTISECYEPDPLRRPSFKDIKTAVVNYEKMIAKV